ncbi:MAG: 16S rRNA (cytidine(1402)-2'-O)-methyltransferase [Candidatus Zixiibacteriota bacterium]|nr:MAG: 16S rRNA (cytidine(1402)-2'-O)-methyltransferase [candidate division Zixibacteria bacterium]
MSSRWSRDTVKTSLGTLYLVPTPIGNLEDMTPRAVRLLREVHWVACEDTRVTGRLLKHFDIQKPLVSYHEFNERARAEQLIEVLRTGESIAVVSDAGSPGISDPAYRIVRMAMEHDVTVTPLPGACAIIPALTGSGLPTDRFFFEGFLPVKSTARRKRLERLREFEHTLVFYESVHRLTRCLGDMAEVLGERQACIAREISKKFEEFLRGSLPELAAVSEKRSLKGEFVIVVAGKPKRGKGEHA